MCTFGLAFLRIRGLENKCYNYSISSIRRIHSSPQFLTNHEFFEDEESKPSFTNEELMVKRNKSRLYPWHQKQINGENPHEVPRHWYHHTIKYKRKLYAQFGEQSGINPGIQWPIDKELQSRLEYESVAYPFTIQELIANVKEKRRLEQEYFTERTKEIETKVASMDKVIKEVLDKKAAREKELLKAKERKEKLMEEVRRHFGYTVDPKDERFQELMTKKEKEERKKLKDVKKLERETKLLERLQKRASTASVETGNPETEKSII